MTDRPWADPDRLAAIEAQTEPDSVLPRIWAATDLVDPKPIRWLAQGRIPEGVVTILVGDEGIGKSLFWVWIAAIVTTGRAAPEYGIPGGPARPVLLVLTEDDWASIARPRLEAAAADLDLVSLICVEPDGTGTPEFPRDMHLIRDLDPAPALIVVDAFIDTNGLHPKTG
ncbi:MAG: AAA family ATPase, partial [Propionibacteriaceae bacterium]|nr:AAA family ATPase [Propionibacteriaceae bacterium]